MKKILIIALFLIVIAGFVTMGAVVSSKALRESDRTIERIDRKIRAYERGCGR